MLDGYLRNRAIVRCAAAYCAVAGCGKLL
jgi:hypothetical protein